MTFIDGLQDPLAREDLQYIVSRGVRRTPGSTSPSVAPTTRSRRAPGPRRCGHHAGAAACSRDFLRPVRHLSARAPIHMSEQGSERRVAERRRQPAMTFERKSLVERWTLDG